MENEEEEESKRLHVGGASNLEKGTAKLTDNASALGEDVAKANVQNTTQTDPALEAFDRLRLKRVEATYHHNASAFLAEFQSIAASLKTDERIKLIASTYEDAELLKAVLSDPQANKICSLRWRYNGKEDVTPIVPLLINSCPELASLNVYLERHSAFDFVSSLLEHSCTKIKELEMPKYAEGDIPRFFAALRQSQVSAFTFSSVDPPEFAQSLHEYLAKDLLVRVRAAIDFERVPPEMTMSLSKCTRLATLEMVQCKFFQPTVFTHLPKSITKLTLDNCTFAGWDWSFLADSNVRKLYFFDVRGVDGTQRGSALAVHLRAKGLDELRLVFCDFINETLAKVGVEIGRIKRLILERSRINDASIKLIALTLQSPNNEMKELKLEYQNDTASSIEDHLVPALKHPNCNLAKLSLPAYQAHKKVAKRVEAMFYNRLALFVLLQGRQLRRLYCPLRRLPVEMFRLVGQVLL